MPPIKKHLGKGILPPDEPAPSFDGFDDATFKFLHGLKKNNKKIWFEAHRDEYEFSLRNPTKALVLAMADVFDELDMPVEASLKRSLFRINRDIRFSADKSPYKTHIGISFPIVGTAKEEWCGFYMGFEPQGAKGISVFIGGGVYQPMPPQLKRIREKISSDYKKFSKLVTEKAFVKEFPKGIEGGVSLKRMPKGYEESDPAAHYLKMKQFLFGADLTEKDLRNENLPQLLGKKFKAALPVALFFAAK